MKSNQNQVVWCQGSQQKSREGLQHKERSPKPLNTDKIYIQKKHSTEIDIINTLEQLNQMTYIDIFRNNLPQKLFPRQNIY